MDISGAYDVKETDATTLSNPSVVDNLEVYDVEEDGCKPVPDLARHSHWFNLLCKQPYQPPWLRVLPVSFTVPIPTLRVLLATLLLSSLFQFPSSGTYMPSPLEMPPWTLQTSSVTYNMLASSTILFSLICTLGFLSQAQCRAHSSLLPPHA